MLRICMRFSSYWTDNWRTYGQRWRWTCPSRRRGDPSIYSDSLLLLMLRTVQLSWGWPHWFGYYGWSWNVMDSSVTCDWWADSPTTISWCWTAYWVTCVYVLHWARTAFTGAKWCVNCFGSYSKWEQRWSQSYRKKKILNKLWKFTCSPLIRSR